MKTTRRHINHVLSAQLRKTYSCSSNDITGISRDCNHTGKEKEIFTTFLNTVTQKQYSYGIKRSYSSPRFQTLLRKWYDLGMKKQDVFSTVPNGNMLKGFYHGDPRYIEKKPSALHTKQTWASIPFYSFYPLLGHLRFDMFLLILPLLHNSTDLMFRNGTVISET